MTTWALTRVELVGALERQRRDGSIALDDYVEAMKRLDVSWARWGQVRDLDAVDPIAAEMLYRHDLRSADALQLASAFVAFKAQPKGKGFVTNDRRLARAAEADAVFIPPSARRRR